MYIPDNPYKATLNAMGFMHYSLEPCVQKVLEYAEATKGYVADIGAAYGYTSLEILKRGGKVLAIDLEQKHLDQLQKTCPPEFLPFLKTESGHFPQTIELPSQTFEGILFLRILLFLTPEEIETALSKAYKSLKSNGMICILTPSPFRKKWKRTLPIYEEQKKIGIPWPGQIKNFWELVPETKGLLPNTIQLIDQESLENALKKVGFQDIETGYERADIGDLSETHLTYAVARRKE